MDSEQFVDEVFLNSMNDQNLNMIKSLIIKSNRLGFASKKLTDLIIEDSLEIEGVKRITWKFDD